EDEDGAVRELATADAMICPDRLYSARIAEAVRGAPKMRWVQLLSAGYDTAQKHGVPANVTLCNAGEAYAPAVPTHALALRLAGPRHLPAALVNQPRHAWDREVSNGVTIPGGSTAAVIGFGPIGREIGRLLRAFGAHVIAVTRRGRPDEHAD